MQAITNELDITKDNELIWGLKYYGRGLCREDDSELGAGRLMLKAAERIKELGMGENK